MGRPRTTSDEQILAVARECFLEHGPAVPTTRIASQLGISHATLFQRFSTKEQLLRAALVPKLDPVWLEQIRSGPDARDGRTQLRDLARSAFEMYQAMIPCLAVLRSAGVLPIVALDKPENLPQFRSRREIEAWFDRAGSNGLIRRMSAAYAADLLLGALMFRPLQQHFGRLPQTPAENVAFLDFVVDAVWNAVRPQRDPKQPISVARNRSPRGRAR